MGHAHGAPQPLTRLLTRGCFKSSSEMSVLEPTWSARSKAVLIEGGSVRGQLVLGEEGGGGLRHLCGRAGAGTGSAERGKLAV